MPAVPKSMATVTMDLSVRTRLLVRSEEELAVRFRLITGSGSRLPALDLAAAGVHSEWTDAAKRVTITRGPPGVELARLRALRVGAPSAVGRGVSRLSSFSR